MNLKIVWYGPHYRPQNMERLLANIPYVTDLIHDGIGDREVIIYQTNDHDYTNQQRLPVPIKQNELV